MPNLPISGLTASASNAAATDVLPVVQTTGTGPVKMTVQQMAGGLLGSTTLSGATITADAPVLNMSQTWNNGAVTFTGLKFNATDTASAAVSNLLDIGTGGGTYESKFSVSKAGVLKLSNQATITSSSTETVFNNGFSASMRFVLGNSAAQVKSPGALGIVVGSGGGGNIGFSTDLDAASNRFLFSVPSNARLNFGGADVGAATATVTITIAAPGVVTWSNHGLSTGTPVVFTTTGALPTGITSGTTYYAVVITANTFQIASSVANAIAATPTVITTSGTQSGTHTGTRYNITQRLSMQSVTGVTDRLGADLIITGSQGTGTGAGGSIIFQVAPAGGTSNAVQNALATALTIDSTRLATFANGISTDTLTGPSGYVLANSSTVALFNSAVCVAASGAIRFSSTSNVINASDIFIVRDDANKLALRNGNNGQTFRLYGRFTDITNDFERFFIEAPTTSGAAVLLGTQKGATTGAARALTFQTDGTSRWSISTAGNLVPSANNTYDIGDGTNNPNVVYASVLAATSNLRFVASTKMAAPSDGVLNFTDSAGTNFDRLQFGGIGPTFPALKRSSTTLIVRLADDTANAPLESASIKTDAPTGGTAATWKLGVRVAATTLLDTTQYIEVDVGGTLYKLAVVTT